MAKSKKVATDAPQTMYVITGENLDVSKVTTNKELNGVLEASGIDRSTENGPGGFEAYCDSDETFFAVVIRGEIVTLGLSTIFQALDLPEK